MFVLVPRPFANITWNGAKVLVAPRSFSWCNRKAQVNCDGKDTVNTFLIKSIFSDIPILMGKSGKIPIFLNTSAFFSGKTLPFTLRFPQILKTGKCLGCARENRLGCARENHLSCARGWWWWLWWWWWWCITVWCIVIAIPVIRNSEDCFPNSQLPLIMKLSNGCGW